jgi:phosphatidate cytidylyltransferase
MTELDPVASIGFGALWSDDGEPESSGTSVEVFDMSQDDYLHTATREHEDLAESIALADDEDTEQVALAAPIPGLDSTVVGFDDVVEAEGLGRVRARASGDLIARIVTAIVLVAALGASLLWRPALVVFALAVFVLGAGEFYTALVRSGRKPIALFGFIGIIGASLGAFFSGALWIPLAFLIAVTLLLLFYAVVPGKIDPMANLALTITVMVWAGLGSFAMLIAKSDSYRTLVFGVVAAVAAMDIAQYFFGRALGRHQLAPWVSPKKTIEGLVAGVIVALTVGALLHFLRPFELTSGLAIGAAVAVFAPLGDLAMSAAKRSLGLKDMGSVLPGHGGFMDRIDGLLFVIPVAWAIFVWAGIL